MDTHNRIIVALDFSNADDALALAQQLDPKRCRVKVGKELFTTAGPVVLERLAKLDFEIFLDLKFHDIPNTVAKACVAAANAGVWMMNVHALGGRRMMEEANNALQSFERPPLLIAVTILTSMAREDLQAIGLEQAPSDHVLQLASLVQQSGLDGVVCSAQEAQMLRQNLGQDFKLITPGIRPIGNNADDQRRVMTPTQALNQGADYLVIGRPITAASDPMQALMAIQTEIDAVN